ncbi:class II fructose-1,6-bisphosphate aldolase [Candidatus Woesearchaeota archaeon]|nr:class II fructose-1,6-bisphosphate aldolase [Candidatus Woesearchaeota archaeon]MBW3016307.1 class II fructose-1,6-bisphosphate aldolase [Candidatus Woesearchaeota archaeon]
MLVTLKQILNKANKENYAVGAFNINNMEICQGIMNAATAQNAPVILQTSQGAIEYAGIDYLKAIVYTAAKQKVPVALHLDHGRDMDIIKKCIKAGWTGIMYDGSHLPIDENIKNTQKVVKWAHAKRIGVEAELGTIGGAEEKIIAREIIYTDPDAAVEFVKKTKIDALAIAIGTSHGAYKFSGNARLDIHLLKTIKQRINMPLVLHGASGVPAWLVTQAARYGAQLGKPEGVPDEQISLAVRNGINKVNTDTDLRLAFDAAVRKFLTEVPEDFDPRNILSPARDLIQQVVEHRIKTFGSSEKAGDKR